MDQRMIEKTKVILNRMKVKLAYTDGWDPADAVLRWKLTMWNVS